MPSCHPAPSEGSKGLSWWRELQDTCEAYEESEHHFWKQAIRLSKGGIGFLSQRDASVTANLKPRGLSFSH